MTDTVRVELGPRSYDILIGAGLIASAGDILARTLPARRVAVVTDEAVAQHHLDPLVGGMREAAVDLAGDPVVLPAGERTKSFSELERLLDTLLGRGLDRSMLLLALGGGVVGDLAGFAAAIALRGIDFVQVPTTLLSQVDSSVGGKTGINSRHGKNLVGAFHQPRLVLADTAALDTLPRRELIAGYAEVVKYGLIDDPDLFGWLEENGPRVVQGDGDARVRAIRASCAAKARIVGADERESAERALLNLGHTFGHALEAEAGYGGALLHGEAVAIGMILAFRLSARLGLCAAEDEARVARHLRSIGLPCRLRDVPEAMRQPEALLAHMGRDKKTRRGSLTFVLARGIGRSFVAKDVDPEAVLDVLKEEEPA